MSPQVSLAIVDASYEPRLGTIGGAASCRYLTSIANVPLISHVLDDLVSAGIEHAAILASPHVRRALAPVLGDGRAHFLDAAAGMPGEQLIARLIEIADGRAVLLYPGDCLFPAQIGQLRELLDTGSFDVVALEAPPPQGARVTPLNRRRVSLGRPERTAMIVAPSAWRRLAASGVPTVRGLDGLLAALEASGSRVGVCKATEWWRYNGSPEELLIANRMILDRMPFGVVAPDLLSDGGEVQGRVVVEPSARVSGSRLRGPVLIGAGAVVEDSFIGPYTTIGPDATVVGAEIEYAMVLAGAQVRYPGHRLEDSVIGERAVVSRSFDLPTGMHLNVGPGARVILG